MAQQLGNVEIDVSNGGYGGDFSLTDNGDLLLAVDTDSNPQATLERLRRLILTNAAIDDQFGNPICEADDLFHTWYGSGVRAEIGQMITPAMLAGIQARCLAGLATDPGVVQSPPPSITVTNPEGPLISIDGFVTLVNGKTYPLPTTLLPLTNQAAS